MADFGPAIIRCKGAAAARLLAAALLVQAEHKRDLGVANPRPHDHPAPRGEFPRGRTWNLRDAVAIDPADVARVKDRGAASVGLWAGGRYGFFLFKRGWKGLPDTLTRVRAQVAALLRGG